MSEIKQLFVNRLLSKFLTNRAHRYCTLCLITLEVFALMITYVAADECSESCAYVHPYTVAHYDRSCITTGFSANYTPRIEWDDGEFSDISVDFVAQLAIGSCCSAFSVSDYGSGIVICGKYKGESVNMVFSLVSERTLPIRCQTRGGLARLTGPALLSIGTKGIGEWVECTGIVKVMFSPPLTTIPNNVVYSTFHVEFGRCTECLESCT